MSEPMKACEAKSNYKGIGLVFFGTRGQARAHAANEFDEDFTDVEVKRCYWADQYIGQEIPKEAYLENGGQWECGDCFTHTGEENAVVIDNVVYCKSCKGGTE